MSSILITQSDTITIQDRVITDYKDGKLVLSRSGDLANMKVGYGGNAIITKKEESVSASLKLTIKAESPDDAFLDASKKSLDSDPPSFVLLHSRVKTESNDIRLSRGFVSDRSPRGDQIIYTITFNAFE